MNQKYAMLPRLLEATVEHALARFPVVVLTGARQTGKSTLAVSPRIGADRLYLTLDDFDVFDRATASPETLVQAAPRLTLDEVQRVPELLRAVKRAVDAERRPGRFLLTGSADLLSLRRVSESLAGRAVFLDLWPMTAAEREGSGRPGPWSSLLAADGAEEALRTATTLRPSATPLREALALGGYPPAALVHDAADRARWFDGYVRSFLEKDLRDLAAIGALADFRRLMRLAALRVGGVLNQSDLARDAALSQPTGHRYLNLLEAAFQIVRIPAFAPGRTVRLVKSPKLYWGDTGLAMHLAGISESGLPGDERLVGCLLENLVLLDILAWRETVAPRPSVYHWRMVVGVEVDFVLEAGRRLLPIEVKATARPRPADAAGLERFLDAHPRTAPFGVLLCGTPRAFRLAPRIVALPIGATAAAG
ncbi:MAG: ATP-binding protein [Deltaproteobacteria bacterium]|nr:ATP-binding protein [Deltaproteobacteria bacterium]